MLTSPGGGGDLLLWLFLHIAVCLYLSVMTQDPRLSSTASQQPPLLSPRPQHSTQPNSTKAAPSGIPRET